MGPEPVLTEVLSAFAETVAEDFTTGEVLRQLAHAAVRALDVDGAGVMVPHGPALLRFAFAAGPAGPAVARSSSCRRSCRTARAALATAGSSRSASRTWRSRGTGRATSSTRCGPTCEP